MDKKIAVLGDIHANLDALETVLADARAQGATDYICVGDVVGYNACPNECCDRIRALGCVTVQGNHDHYCAFDESLDDFTPLAATVVDWTRRQLSTENREWLRSLPYQKVEKGITIVHATLDQPEQTDKWITPGVLDGEQRGHHRVIEASEAKEPRARTRVDHAREDEARTQRPDQEHHGLPLRKGGVALHAQRAVRDDRRHERIREALGKCLQKQRDEEFRRALRRKTARSVVVCHEGG